MRIKQALETVADGRGGDAVGLFANFPSMPLDARRWSNAVTTGWLIAEGMGMHCKMGAAGGGSGDVALSSGEARCRLSPAASNARAARCTRDPREPARGPTPSLVQ